MPRRTRCISTRGLLVQWPPRCRDYRSWATVVRRHPGHTVMRYLQSNEFCVEPDSGYQHRPRTALRQHQNRRIPPRVHLQARHPIPARSHHPAWVFWAACPHEPRVKLGADPSDTRFRGSDDDPKDCRILDPYLTKPGGSYAGVTTSFLGRTRCAHDSS